MNLKLIFAVNLFISFLGWTICGLIPGRAMRGIFRATVIALLCSPGFVIGHGFAVVPSLFALYVQPSIYTLVPMLIVWLLALGVIFGVPALRNGRNEWPLSPKDIFLSAYVPKFFFFGVITSALMLALLYNHQQRALWVVALKYGLFFAGALANMALCYWVTREKEAKPFLAPLFYSAPALFATAPTVPFMWYGGGVIGSLIGSGHPRIAAWISLGVFVPLSVYAFFRIYLAATAQPHVNIGGGVVGNAIMAIVFGGIGILMWIKLRRHPRGES